MYDCSDDRAPVGVTIGGRVLLHEPSTATKLKACAALLLKGEAFGLSQAAEELDWHPVALHKVTGSWCDTQELLACWMESTREELATFLLFVAEAEAQG